MLDMTTDHFSFGIRRVVVGCETTLQMVSDNALQYKKTKAIKDL